MPRDVPHRGRRAVPQHPVHHFQVSVVRHLCTSRVLQMSSLNVDPCREVKKMRRVRFTVQVSSDDDDDDEHACGKFVLASGV